jgi:hypothetical protein
MSSTEIELGNLDMEHFESTFHAWLADRDTLNAMGIMDDLSVACVASFSPLRYVCYGSLSPHSHVLLFQDAKNSPVRVVARLELDPDMVTVWRRSIR